MTEKVIGTYEDIMFTFQMGVNPREAGCRDANLMLTAILKSSRHKHNRMFCLFTNFKGAFTSLTLELTPKVP